MTYSFFNESIDYIEQPVKMRDITPLIEPTMYVKFNNLMPGTSYLVEAWGWERNRYWVPCELPQGMRWPEFETENDESSNLVTLNVVKYFICPDGTDIKFATDIRSCHFDTKLPIDTKTSSLVLSSSFQGRTRRFGSYHPRSGESNVFVLILVCIRITTLRIN